MNGAERWLDTWVAREFRKQFDFEGQISLEEFCFKLQFVGDTRGQPIPNPPIQVAQDADFVWNEAIRDQTFNRLWDAHLSRTMNRVLSASAIDRFKAMGASGKASMLADSLSIYKNLRLSRQGRSKDSPVLDWSHAVRAYRARESSKPRPQLNRVGQTVATGVCLDCLDCATCWASRTDKTKCNDKRRK